MPAQSLCIFSNRIERLCAALCTNLYSKTLSTPFTKRLIIVPNQAIKEWLQWQIAKNPTFNVCTGIDFIFLSQALDRLMEDKQRNKKCPNASELALEIEKCVICLLNSFSKMSKRDQKKLSALMHYLKLSSPKPTWNKSNLKRLLNLSDYLSQFFGEYDQQIIERVKKDKNLLKEQWQVLIWDQIFSNNSPWMTKEQRFQMENKTPISSSQNTMIHIFGFSYIHPLHMHFLNYITSFIDVFFYILSPCQIYWSDAHSDFENRKIYSYWKDKGANLKHLTNLESYLKSRNPLLANLGKLSKQSTLNFEILDFPYSIDAYQGAQWITKHPHYQDLITIEQETYPDTKISLLGAIQNDLLLNKTDLLEKKKVQISKEDTSIEIHKTPSLLREVQVLYDNILTVLHKHSQDTEPIDMGDILVLAPNISLYTPFIETVFGKEKSPLLYEITDIPLIYSSKILQTFMHLIKMSQGSFDTFSVLKLFENDHFLKASGLSKHQIQKIYKKIQTSKIYWGFDANHKSSLLQEKYPSLKGLESPKEGSWKKAFESWIQESCEENTSDKEQEDREDQESLLCFAKIVTSLYEDLNRLRNHEHFSIQRWCHILKNLMEKYFSFQKDEEDEERDYLFLLSQLEDFPKTFHSCFESKTFSFASFLHHLEKYLNQASKQVHKSQFHAIVFSSLKAMQSISAKVICMLGANEEDFPQKSTQKGLNLNIYRDSHQYDPKPCDIDRDLFLKVLISARRYLIISYQNFSSQDGKELSCSIILKELINYLDDNFSLEERSFSDSNVFSHSPLPFDAKYFSPSEKQKSYQEPYYKASQVFYAGFKKESLILFKNTSQHPKAIQEVSIDQLSSFAKNPLKLFFSHSLEMDIDSRFYTHFFPKESFSPSLLDVWKATQKAMGNKPEKSLEHWKKQIHLSQGIFTDIAQADFQKKIALYYNFLMRYGMEEGCFYSVKFQKETLKKEKKQPRIWSLPALKIPKEGGHILVEGQLNLICKEGLIIDQEDDIKGFFKALPQIIIYYSLPSEMFPQEKRKVFFLKNQKTKTFSFCPQQALQAYIDYLIFCSQTPCLALPEWISSLLKDEKKFFQNIESSLSEQGKRFFNPYAFFMLRSKEIKETSLKDHVNHLKNHLMPFLDIYSTKT